MLVRGSASHMLLPVLVLGGAVLASILLHVRLYSVASKVLPEISRSWGTTFPYLEVACLRNRRQVGSNRLTLLALLSLASPVFVALAVLWIQARAQGGG